MGRFTSASAELKQRSFSGQTFNLIDDALKAGIGKDCGANVQLAFRLFEGDLVRFDAKNTMAAYVKKQVFEGKEYSFLFVSAFLNERPCRFPVWALRRQVFGTPTEDSMSAWRALLSSNTFYQEIMDLDNDVERALYVAGKQYLVGETKISYTVKDKSGSQTVWTFSEKK